MYLFTPRISAATLISACFRLVRSLACQPTLPYAFCNHLHTLTAPFYLSTSEPSNYTLYTLSAVCFHVVYDFPAPYTTNNTIATDSRGFLYVLI